jgi:hypothetical protein
MWTAIEPGTCANKSQPECGEQFDSYPDTWHNVFTLKMSDAVHRAGFRRELVSDIKTTMQEANKCQNHTSPIAPAGHAAFWDDNFKVGAHVASAGINYEGQPAVVVELTNMTLSMWAQQDGSFYSPWSTKPQLGVKSNQDLPAYMRFPKDPVWSDVVFMIRRLRDFMTHPDGEVLDVYLIGDAWEVEMVDAFKAYLRNHRYTDMNVEFRGMFAASDGAASVARRMIDECGP